MKNEMKTGEVHKTDSAADNPAGAPTAKLEEVQAATDSETPERSLNAQPLPNDQPSTNHQPSTDGQPRAPHRDHRRGGKIAHLSRRDRDRINEMISDGFTYREILEELGEVGQGITEKNLSIWKAGGYQAWERERQRLQSMRFRQEFAGDLVRENDGLQTHQAGFQIAALQICDLVNDFDPALLKEALQTNPTHYAMLLNAYTHLLNAMPKLSQAEAECQRRRSEAAAAAVQAKPESEKAPEKPPGLSAEAQRLMEQKLNLM